MNSAADVWTSILNILGEKLTTTTMNAWFDDSRAISLEADRFILYSPSKFRRDIIRSRYADAVKEALYELFSMDFEFVVVGDEELNSLRGGEKEPAFGSNEFTFERFIVGSSNKFAHAAAIAVAENPGSAYNPLFIYGESGLGKTHLLYAIGNAIKAQNPAASIVYIKGDDFTNELVNAIQTGKNIEFRQKYRGADLFLVDDVQFIAGKTQTQEEFFHTFNTLFEAHKQIVLTSDRPPMEIKRLEDRLQSRFESGLLADISRPDYETRVAIIKNKAIQLGLPLQEEIPGYIAERVTSNIRQLEGVVKKLTAYRDLLGGDVDLPKVQEIIDEIIKEKVPTPEDIIKETAGYYALESEDLTGQRKTHEIALARQISMYLIRNMTKLSLKEIGACFENRDHTTVLSSVTKIEKLIEKDQEFADTVKDIRANILARG